MALVSYKDPNITAVQPGLGTDIFVTPATPLPVTNVSGGAAAALADGAANPTTQSFGADLSLYVGPTWNRWYAASVVPDGATGTVMAPIASWLYRGDLTFDRARTPTTFKTVAATASGDTALWTPTSGKKFRLMGLVVELSGNAQLGAAATFTILLRDATTATGLGFSASVGAAAISTSVPNLIESGVILLGNGILSAAANNVLNVNLSAALTAGVARVSAFGTEE